MKAAEFFANQRGGTVIEAVATTSALALSVTLGLGIAYLSFARVWIERNAYEALICLSTSEGTGRCERTFIESIENALPIGKISSVNTSRNSHRGAIRVRFEIDGRVAIRHSANLRYPLLKTRGQRGVP